MKPADKRTIPSAIKTGSVVVSLKTAPDVKVAAADEAEFRKRFDIAWRFATGRLALGKTKVTNEYQIEFKRD